MKETNYNKNPMLVCTHTHEGSIMEWSVWVWWKRELQKSNVKVRGLVNMGVPQGSLLGPLLFSPCPRVSHSLSDVTSSHGFLLPLSRWRHPCRLLPPTLTYPGSYLYLHMSGSHLITSHVFISSSRHLLWELPDHSLQKILTGVLDHESQNMVQVLLGHEVSPV